MTAEEIVAQAIAGGGNTASNVTSSSGSSAKASAKSGVAATLA